MWLIRPTQEQHTFPESGHLKKPWLTLKKVFSGRHLWQHSSACWTNFTSVLACSQLAWSSTSFPNWLRKILWVLKDGPDVITTINISFSWLKSTIMASMVVDCGLVRLTLHGKIKSYYIVYSAHFSDHGKMPAVKSLVNILTDHLLVQQG